MTAVNFARKIKKVDTCHGKFSNVFLFPGGSGAVTFVRKEKIMTVAGKMLGKLFSKTEHLRQ